MEIKNLIDSPKYIEEVSKKIWQEWQKNDINWLSLDDTIKRTKNIFKAKLACPTMLIALDWNILVGTVSLWISDISERQDLFPFVASLYIKSEYRKKWLAKKLLLEIEKVAKNNNWKELYLNDGSKINWFYEKMWFNFYEKDNYKWKEYLIYKKILK